MPPFGPIGHQELVRALRRLGFKGPLPGTKHPFMVKGTMRLRIPNPHRGDVGPELLRRLLKQGGISRDEWESA